MINKKEINDRKKIFQEIKKNIWDKELNFTYKEISKAYKIPSSTIYYWKLKFKNNKELNYNYGKSILNSKYSDDLINQVYEYKKNHSYKQTSEKFNIPKGTIQNKWFFEIIDKKKKNG